MKKEKINLKKELKETKTNLKMSWFFVKNSKKSLFLMIFLTAILSGISLLTPILSARLLLNLTDGILDELLKTAIFVFLVEITRNFVSYFLSRVNNLYMVKTLTDVQMKMFEETLKIETSEIDKNTSGTFIDRINNDTNDIIDVFTNLASRFIDLVSNVGIVIAVLIINRYMFLYFLVSSTIISYIDKKNRDIYFRQSKEFRRVRESKTGLISEIIRGIRDVKLLDAEEGILKVTRRQLDKVNKERLAMLKTDRFFRLMYGNIRDLLDVVFFAFGTILVYLKNLTPANFLVLYMYKGRIESLMDFYNSFVRLIKSFNLSATRVFEVLGTHFKKEKDQGKEVATLEGNIEIKNVSFAYGKENVLNNINLKINKGERVGFVGVSGSGKSTLFNLITRLYRLKTGDILIDGMSINKISLKSLRHNIALIPQHPYIFNFSIEENLKITNKKATPKELIEACEKAQIYDRILEFKKKFKTEVGEGGVTLSGGEKQRLAIARSLLKKCNIILFDEATSALDNVTQHKVQKAIYGLDKEKTILIIAHRLSTVISCDKIVVIDEGKIVDVGKHDELLKRCQKYQELFKYEQSQN